MREGTLFSSSVFCFFLKKRRMALTGSCSWTYHKEWFTEATVSVLRKALKNHPEKYERYYTHQEVEGMKAYDSMAYLSVPDANICILSENDELTNHLQPCYPSTNNLTLH